MKKKRTGREKKNEGNKGKKRRTRREKKNRGTRVR